jgi:hypothetical protein
LSSEAIINNTLYAMAQTMSSREDYPTAVALRKLAWAGYTSLEQVDRASDWMLLAIPGVGVGRLTAIRRLIRPDWQPPRSRLFKVAERFLSAARFALRFWPVEDLEGVIQGSVSLPAGDSPIEKRLSLEQFAQATRKALRHREAEVWVPALRQVAHQHAGQRHGMLETRQDSRSKPAVPAEGHRQPPTPNSTTAPPRLAATALQSDHYAFSLEERRQIVDHYRTARRNGEVENKEAWARNNYHISRKTLWRYEQEFPEL